MTPTPDHTFAAGWNARCDNQKFLAQEVPDWCEGWIHCNEVPPSERLKFNDDAWRPR